MSLLAALVLAELRLAKSMGVGKLVSLTDIKMLKLSVWWLCRVLTQEAFTVFCEEVAINGVRLAFGDVALQQDHIRD